METRSGRTPNSILRKRQNKENVAAKLAKRSKMMGRRVSFAPDDELETMHLFAKDGKGPLTPPDTTANLTLDLSNHQGLADANYPGPSWHEALAPRYQPSPGIAPSPMSMDLTNTSMDQQQMRQHMQQQQQQPGAWMQRSAQLQSREQEDDFEPQLDEHAAAGGGVDGADADAYASQDEEGNQDGLQPSMYGNAMQQQDYTRNITSNIPALSTLVEEDEEAGYSSPEVGDKTSSPMQLTDDLLGEDGAPNAGGGHGCYPVEICSTPAVADCGLGGYPSPSAAFGVEGSPTSPFVLQHFQQQQQRSPGETPTTGNLRDKWGFNPGADDTLDVSHGHLVMGDKTYNHVYGAGTTGTLTRGMNGDGAGGGFAASMQLINASTAPGVGAAHTHALAVEQPGEPNAAAQQTSHYVPSPLPSPFPQHAGAAADLSFDMMQAQARSAPASSPWLPQVDHSLPANPAAVDGALDTVAGGGNQFCDTPELPRRPQNLSAAELPITVQSAVGAELPDWHFTAQPSQAAQAPDLVASHRNQPSQPTLPSQEVSQIQGLPQAPFQRQQMELQSPGMHTYAASQLPSQPMHGLAPSPLPSQPPPAYTVAQLMPLAPRQHMNTEVTICLLADDGHTAAWRAPLRGSQPALPTSQPEHLPSSQQQLLHASQQAGSQQPLHPSQQYVPQSQLQESHQFQPASQKQASQLQQQAYVQQHPQSQPLEGRASNAHLGRPLNRSSIELGATTALLGGGGTTRLLQPNYTTHLLSEGQQLGRTSLMGGITAASTSAAPPRPTQAADRTASSQDYLQRNALAASGSRHSDALLDEQTLDDFALPPTPSAPKQQQPQPSLAPHPPTFATTPGGRSIGTSTGTNTLLLRAAAAAALPESPSLQSAAGVMVHQPAGRRQAVVAGAVPRSVGGTQRTLHPITCQDFLSMLGMSFAEKVRRTSFLPQADPPPTTLSEMYEAAFCTGPRIEQYQAMMSSMAGRLGRVQAGLQAAEADLAFSNPPLFKAVQLASPAELDTLKDQMILLKKICRLRVTKAQKQLKMQHEAELAHGFNGSMRALQEELAWVKARIDEASQMQQAVSALQVSIAQRTQDEHTEYQETLARQKAEEAARQRAADLQASNSQREQRLAESEEQRQQLQKQYEDALQRRAQLQTQVHTMRAKNAAVATPGKVSRLAAQLLARQEEVDVLLGLQGMALDASRMRSHGVFQLTMKGQFHIRVDSSTTVGAGLCTVSVDAIPGSTLQSCPSARALLPHAVASCLATCDGATLLSNNSISICTAHLRTALPALQARLACAARLLAQSSNLLLNFPLLSNIRWLTPAEQLKSASADEGQAGSVDWRSLAMASTAAAIAAATPAKRRAVSAAAATAPVGLLDGHEAAATTSVSAAACATAAAGGGSVKDAAKGAADNVMPFSPATNLPALLSLDFLNPSTCTRISVALPAASLPHLHTTLPCKGGPMVTVHLPRNASGRGDEIRAVLADIQPSGLYLQHVCMVMSTILLAPGGGGGGSGSNGPAIAGAVSGPEPDMGDADVLEQDVEAKTVARTPLRPNRVYDNPVFDNPLFHAPSAPRI